MAKRSVVDEFKLRLRAAEHSGDARDLCALFSDEARLLMVTRHHTPSKSDHAGPASSFWRQYLAAFDSIESEFEREYVGERFAVLEWSAQGTLPMGIPLHYCGVTLIEHDNDFIHGLRTYFDSAALLPHANRIARTHSETVGEPEITNQATS